MKEYIIGGLIGAIFAALLIVTLVDMTSSYPAPVVTFERVGK